MLRISLFVIPAFLILSSRVAHADGGVVGFIADIVTYDETDENNDNDGDSDE